jgi:osmoprotectant transport system substrate-binding protein
MRLSRALSAVALISAMSMAMTACGGSSNNLSTKNTPSTSSTGAAAPKSIVIGSAGFTEIQLMAEMYKLLLDKAGYQTSIKVVQNREVYEPALQSGDIGVVPDYAATMTEFLNVKANGASAAPVATSDKDATVAALNKLGAPLGIKALQAANAVDQNAFAVTKAYATKNHLTNMSDLSGKSVVVAATEECPDRPFCQPGLEKTYGIKVTKILPLGFGTAQVKAALKDGKAQLGLVGTTDATLGDLGLVLLKDDKGLQLADNLVPVVGKAFLNDTKLADALNALATVLTTDDLAQLDKKVDGERQKPADVAKDYLTSKGLI